MANSNQTFTNDKPVTFTVTGDDNGTTVAVDETKVVYTLVDTNGTCGTLDGSVLTPVAGQTGAGVLTATYEQFTATDTITIVNPAPVLTDITVSGAQ